MKTILLCLFAVGASASPAHRPFFRRGYPQIVGGSDASPGEFPYQLSFQDTSYGTKFHFCAASIYNNFTSITAGHCVFGENYNRPKDLQIVAGEHNLQELSGDEQEIKVVQIILHKKFDYGHLYNDIALLRGETTFKFNDKVEPVKLPKWRQSTNGTCTVTGWGTLYTEGPISNVLQKVDVPVVSDEVCRAAYGTRAILNSMICAGEAGKDSCHGDSGGPLMCGDYLGGIVSWGYGCAEANFPGVYTEVSHFVRWIHKHSF